MRMMKIAGLSLFVAQGFLLASATTPANSNAVCSEIGRSVAIGSEETATLTITASCQTPNSQDYSISAESFHKDLFQELQKEDHFIVKSVSHGTNPDGQPFSIAIGKAPARGTNVDADLSIRLDGRGSDKSQYSFDYSFPSGLPITSSKIVSEISYALQAPHQSTVEVSLSLSKSLIEGNEEAQLAILNLGLITAKRHAQKVLTVLYRNVDRSAP